MHQPKQTTHNALPIKRALAYFAAAYIMVNILATIVSVVYGVLTNAAQPVPGTSLLKAPAFKATVPYHVLIMVVVWTIFAWAYFRKRSIHSREQMRHEVMRLSLFWLCAAMIADFICFVVPSFFTHYTYSFTPHDFYVNYQPWISLIYLAIFISPWIYFGLPKQNK